MPQVKAVQIELTDRTTTLLNSIIRKQNSPQCISRRAQIILMSAHGLGNKTIGTQLDIDRRTVRHWRTKWYNASETLSKAESQNLNDKEFIQLIIDILTDEQRPGAPATFTAEQIVQVVAIACEIPRDSNREISHWSLREIADEAQKRNIVDTISARSVGRFLKSGCNKTTS